MGSGGRGTEGRSAVVREVTEEFAEAAEACVDEESDIGDGEAGGVCDFAVAEVVLEFEPEAFRLIAGEFLEELENGGGVVVGGGGFSGLEGFRGDAGEVLRVRADEAAVAAEPVDGAVAADGEEPCFEARAVESGGICVGAEAEKGILNDIACGVVVAGDAGGVAGEGGAELVDGPEDEFPWDGLGRLGRVHVGRGRPLGRGNVGLGRFPGKKILAGRVGRAVAWRHWMRRAADLRRGGASLRVEP